MGDTYEVGRDYEADGILIRVEQEWGGCIGSEDSSSNARGYRNANQGAKIYTKR